MGLATLEHSRRLNGVNNVLSIPAIKTINSCTNNPLNKQTCFNYLFFSFPQNLNSEFLSTSKFRRIPVGLWAVPTLICGSIMCEAILQTGPTYVLSHRDRAGRPDSQKATLCWPVGSWHLKCGSNPWPPDAKLCALLTESLRFPQQKICKFGQ